MYNRENKKTPLHLAVEKGASLEVVRLFLEKGSDVHATTESTNSRYSIR